MQHLEALAKGNAIRVAAVREREALMGQPVAEIVNAIIEPTEVLASMRLKVLLCPRERSSIFPYIGPRTLTKVLVELDRAHPLAGRSWSPETRLRELSREGRRQLARTLVRHAPKAWRES